VISKGLHFNSLTSKSSGRPGEPWVLVDGITGTQLPMSYRSRPGLNIYKPQDIGLTPWSFTQMFGRHMPGGGPGSPADISSPAARWGVSGTVEINCMGCHNASYKQDHSEWAKQMMRGNYLWAGTAASGLGQVGGMASRQSDIWNVHKGPSPDDTGFATPPAVNYDLSMFDTKGRAMLNVGSPKDKQCLSCHSTARVGVSKWRSDRDVHSAAGMSCVQCHRNGISHNIVRGYARESGDRKDPEVASLSCRGCHMGTDGSGAKAMGGRLGAPKPKHAGLPSVHLKKLTCTACHSGPMPASKPTRVRTARINRMGIFGRAQWYTEAPNISEGVLARGADGKIGPKRMMWPAFWARLDGEKVTPLLPAEVKPMTKGVFDGPQQIAKILNTLAGPINDELSREIKTAKGIEKWKKHPRRSLKFGGLPVLIHKGRIYRLNADGGLDISEFKGKLPVMLGLLAREREGEILVLLRAVEADLEPEYEFLTENGETREEIIPVLIGMLKALNATSPSKNTVAVLDYGSVAYQRTLVSRPADADKKKGLKADKDAMAWDLVGTAITGGELREVPRLAWMNVKTKKISPLITESVIQGVIATAGVEESFTEQQVGVVLGKLQESKGGTYAYISGGKMFTLGSDGKVVASDNGAAEPYLWPMAHGVRPASQSLGVRGCTDCHSSDSAFFFGKITGSGPLLTESVAVKSMHELQGLDAEYHRLFGMTFLFRPIFKTVLFTAAGLIGLMLLAYGTLMLRGLGKFAGGEKRRFWILDKLAGLVVCALTIVLVGTGFYNIVLSGEMISGWLLMTHVLLGAVYTVALLGLILFRSTDCSESSSKRFGTGQKIGFWMVAFFGFALALTAGLATLPVIGTCWTDAMASIHLYLGVGMIVSSLVYLIGSICRKKA
ncbi:MAG: hypothetical protein GY794_05140, partial [bacterium]|nr:hypothetical protein [bacterium]